MENNKTSKVKISAFTISLDGFGTGLNQSKENPMGVKGSELHPWMRPTKMFQKMMGKNGGTVGVDNDFAERSMENIGAWIMGRNMFAPSRGPWSDDGWKGWWGEEPPYHGPTYILTHHAREPIEMKGGTTFYFITGGGIEAALAEAKKAANGKDIRILGGVSTIRQYLQAGYVDEMHFVISPVFLGSGEHLFSGIDMSKLGFNQIQRVEGENPTHIVLTKSNK